MFKTAPISKHSGHAAVISPGDRFGNLLVRWECDRPESLKGHGRYYWCHCICGNEKEIRGTRLTSGNVRSCGCRKAALRASKIRLENDGAAVNIIYAGYKKKAQTRARYFSLSKDDVRRLVTSRCHYCGEAASNKLKVASVYFFYNGIDRVDSAAGYTPENSVPCCSMCNRAKMAMPRNKFLAWVERVGSYQAANKTISVINPYFIVMVQYKDGSEAVVNPTLTRSDIVEMVRVGEWRSVLFIHEVAGAKVVDRTEEIFEEARCAV